MSLYAGLVAIKTANVALNALVGTRFHPEKLQQNTALPAIRFQEISRVEKDWNFQGRPTLVTIRIQVDGYAASDDLRTALRAAFLDAFLPSAARVSGSYGGESILDIRLDGSASGVEMLNTNTEARTFRRDLICDCRWSTTL